MSAPSAHGTLMLQQRRSMWLQGLVKCLVAGAVILLVSACSDNTTSTNPSNTLASSPSASTTSTAPVAEPLTVSLEHLENQVSELLRAMLAEARRQPTSGNLRGQLAMAYEVNGFRDAALTTYQQAEALSPKDARWPYFQARLLMKQVEPEVALAKLQRTLTLKPDHIPSLMWQGTWLLDQGHWQRAEAAFNKAKQHGLGWAADASLARVLLNQKRTNEAVALLETLSRKSPFPIIFHLLGMAYRDIGEVDKARIALARGKNAQNIGWLDPWEDLKAPYRISFEARLRKAQTMIRRGRMTESIALLQKLQGTQPHNPVVLTTLSNAFVLHGEQQKGFWILRRALEQEPVHYSIHLNIANFYTFRGDIATALQHFNTSIQINPDAAEPYARKATLLKKLGLMEDALAAFDSSLEKNASNPQLFIDAGDIHKSLSQTSNALSRYRQAIDVDPSYLPGYLKLANLLIQSNQLGDARQVLDHASLLGDQTGQVDALVRRLAHQ
jgi:tetratricopeptide (TPR) repeat protein